MAYAYFDLTAGKNEPVPLRAMISLASESASLKTEIVEFRRILEGIVRQTQQRLTEWEIDYARLYDSSKGEDPRLLSCKRVLHEYFTCESVLFEPELRKLALSTHLTTYAEIKSPLLPKPAIEVGLSPLVKRINPPRNIFLGRFLIGGKEVDLRDSQTFSSFLDAIRAEPIASWIKRNRQRDGLDSWMYPIQWTELGIPHGGEKHVRFFDDPLALEGRYGSLFYVTGQQPRVNKVLRYALHKIARSSIAEHGGCDSRVS